MKDVAAQKQRFSKEKTMKDRVIIKPQGEVVIAEGE